MVPAADRFRSRLARLRNLAKRSESAPRPMPTPVELDLGGSMQHYYFRRVIQSAQDWYAGVRMAKFPEDLRTYEHLLWEMRADTVIEVGTAFGGSALWFRDRLRELAHYGRVSDYRVITLDVNVDRPRDLLDAADPTWKERITLVEGDVSDLATAEKVTSLLPRGARCLVVEDSAHTYQTTMGALRSFAACVPQGGYFVVEDGYIDVEEMVPGPDWNWVPPHGVLPAVADWLKTEEGSAFQVRRDLELYGLTSNPHGFLQRVR